MSWTHIHPFPFRSSFLGLWGFQIWVTEGFWLQEKSMSNSVSTKSSQLKLYKFFMLCVPIFFTFLLLVLFYLFYLRPRRVNTSWQNYDDISRVSFELFCFESILDCFYSFWGMIYQTEMGLKKELREMLPIIVYKESFFVRDSQ